MKNKSRMAFCAGMALISLFFFNLAESFGQKDSGRDGERSAGTRSSASSKTDKESEGSRPPRMIDSKAAETGDSKPAPPSVSEADRIRALEEALRLQSDRLAQMEKMISEQTRIIQSLGAGTASISKEVSAGEARATAASRPTEATAAAEKSDTAAPAPSVNQQPSLEDRLKGVEERARNIGPIRLSGDFRLRLDGILRRATESPDPPLQHAQNVRMRYRFRLNLDSNILNKAVCLHAQLSTGPINNALTQDQDFTSTVAHHPLFINEAWIDYSRGRDCGSESREHRSFQLQGGRVKEVFADNSRFLFDDDVRFNGFNETFVIPFRGARSSLELRAAQYWFSNPNVAVIAPGSPLANAGAEIGKIGRSSNLFHQGLLLNTRLGENWQHQFGGDVQVFREPNQIQLASTAEGVVFLVQPGLGLVLSGPMTGAGNATTRPGGAIYTAEDFHVARLTYRVRHTGFSIGKADAAKPGSPAAGAKYEYPISLNVQVSRNFGTDAKERDAFLTALQIGNNISDKPATSPAKFGDMSFLYVFSIKGANSIISQLTDDDLGTGSGVNLRTHHFRWELGLAPNVTLQSLLFVQRELRNSGQFPNFFVPLNAFTPRQYRFQEQIVFSFK